jgi:hypothetical protein
VEDSLGSRQYRDGSLAGVVGAVEDLLGCQVGWWADEEALVVQTFVEFCRVYKFQRRRNRDENQTRVKSQDVVMW